MYKTLIAFVASFFLGMVIAPAIIWLIKKLKARQTILGYVTQHKDKEGIPTMGGVIFIVASSVIALIFFKAEKTVALSVLLINLSYGIIGGLDDLIKVLFKRNLGLKAYQKIISQILIAVFATYFAYKNINIGTQITIPMFNISVDLKWWYFPLSIFLYIAVTNSVNLTDGLDGLAGSTVSVYLMTFLIIIYFLYVEAVDDGRTFYGAELLNLAVYVSAVMGGVCAFLWYNSFRASVFMGDTGSMFLGGCCVTIPLAIKNPLLIALAGIMFVVSSISVLVQVISFKLRGKRVFLMSPYHHHLEMKGINESKIVAYYSIITAICGVVTILIR